MATATTTTEWTVLEKLLLAQAVYKYGADDWFQITRTLRNHPMMRQQPEFYNQKNCSLQYYLLIESLEAEKRQPNLGGPPSQDIPDVVRIANQLYTQRMEELRRLLKEDEDKFMSVVAEIEEIRAGKWDAKLTKAIEDNPQLAGEVSPVASAGESGSAVDTETKVPDVSAADNVGQSAVGFKRKSESVMTRAPPVDTENDVAKKRPRLEEPVANVDQMPLDQITKSERPAQTAVDPLVANPQPQQHESSAEEPKEQHFPQDNTSPQQQTEQAPSTAHDHEEPQERPDQDFQARVHEDEVADISKPELEQPKHKEEPHPLEMDQRREQTEGQDQPGVDHPQDTTEPATFPGEPHSVEAMETSDIEDDRAEPMEMPEKTVESTSHEAWPASTSNTHIPIIANSTERGSPPILTHSETFSEKQEFEAESPVAATTHGTNSPATTSGHDRDGTESITGSESNAATPTHSSDRKRTKDDQRQKSWQKNINLLWREIANHKNGAMYMNPIKEATAPLYYDIVKHPIDLKTIKNRIRDGVIKTTTEFERDIILMLTNSLMYNREGTEIYQMAVEMLDDVTEQLRVFKTADANSSTSFHTRSASALGGTREQ